MKADRESERKKEANSPGVIGAESGISRVRRIKRGVGGGLVVGGLSLDGCQKDVLSVVEVILVQHVVLKGCSVSPSRTLFHVNVRERRKRDKRHERSEGRKQDEENKRIPETHRGTRECCRC